MGVAACQMEKKGIATEKGELNRNIQKANRLIREIRAQIGKLKEWIADLFKARETAPEPVSYTHLRDMSLSLKAKGLLSLMLSLPENWDYTMKGLARICKDGIDSISGGIRELEAHGYLIRARVRGANGQLGSIEYTILEQPKAPSPTQEKPIRENPVQANPMLDAPIQENPAQIPYRKHRCEPE